MIMLPVQYRPIGAIESSCNTPLSPEKMRGLPARLILEPGFAQAIAAVEAGQHLWVIYHLHAVQPHVSQPPTDLFTRRIATRPNPIGITLVRVMAVDGSTITVIGLDAVDGTPILDLKPYQPIWDEPPVHPDERQAEKRAVIVLTGGPGGGKSTLIKDLQHDPAWVGRFVTLPETVQTARLTSVSPSDKLFQRVMVQLQISLEDGLKRSLGPGDPRPILCHRGSLDPLAFWLQRGWDEDEFYLLGGLSRSEHYRRYAAVIHLVTAADGAPDNYARWPETHRPETSAQAIQLDRWLGEAWSGHPCYYRLDNEGRNWEAKSLAAREILAHYLKR